MSSQEVSLTHAHIVLTQVCSLLALADIRLLGHRDSSEHFQTASRNIKTGLIAGAPHAQDVRVPATRTLVPALSRPLHPLCVLAHACDGLPGSKRAAPDRCSGGLGPAVDVVSHWTWSITLLQSSAVAWNYGIAGPFWCVACWPHVLTAATPAAAHDPDSLHL